MVVAQGGGNIRGGNLPETLNEPVTFSEYDPLWPKQFQSEQDALRATLGAGVEAIEHFGGTSVPGLGGKPVLDVLLAVNRFPLSELEIAGVNKLGYEYFGDVLAPDRLYFRKRRPESFNVLVVEQNGSLFTQGVLFRDFLRSHSQAAQRYENAKRDIIASGVSRLFEYATKKGPYVSQLLEEASAWQRNGRS